MPGTLPRGSGATSSFYQHVTRDENIHSDFGGANDKTRGLSYPCCAAFAWSAAPGEVVPADSLLPIVIRMQDSMAFIRKDGFMLSPARLLPIACLLACGLNLRAASTTIWQIGNFDKSSREFARGVSPTRGGALDYSNPADDPVYVIGKSQPGKNWLAYQPGTSNGKKKVSGKKKRKRCQKRKR